MAIQELHVHTTCRVKERSWTQSHLLECYRLWQVDFSIALFFASNLIRFYEKYSIPLNYNVGILSWFMYSNYAWPDFVSYTFFVSKDRWHVQTIQNTKIQFSLLPRDSLTKTEISIYTKFIQLNNCKNKNRGYNIFILIACSIINWRPFQFFRHATLMISNNQRNKKHLFYI